MTDPIEKLEEELRALRPRPLAPETASQLRRSLAEGKPSHRVPWFHGRSPALRWALAAAAALAIALGAYLRAPTTPPSEDSVAAAGILPASPEAEYQLIALGRAFFADPTPGFVVSETGEPMRELRFFTVDHFRFRRRGDGGELRITQPGEERRLISLNMN